MLQTNKNSQRISSITKRLIDLEIQHRDCLLFMFLGFLESRLDPMGMFTQGRVSTSELLTHIETILQRAEKLTQSIPAPLRFKPLDIAYSDRLNDPRVLVLTCTPSHRFPYEVVSADGSLGSYSRLMTMQEWVVWSHRFDNELPQKDMREYTDHVTEPYEEPQVWGAFRKRFHETGDLFIH